MDAARLAMHMTTGAGHPAAKRPDLWRRRARVAAWLLLAAFGAQCIILVISLLYPFKLRMESMRTGEINGLEVSPFFGIVYASSVWFGEDKPGRLKLDWQLGAFGWQFGVSRIPKGQVGEPDIWAQRFGLTWPHYNRIDTYNALVLGVAIPLWCLMLPTMILAVLFKRAGRRRSPPGFCPFCRYDLTANTSGICPECGSRIEPEQTASPRGS